jgi:outer membrane protein OmpA-like peptidoglycan-associated protein
MRFVPLLMGALPAMLNAAELEIGTPVSFVACPIYRDADAGRKSGCWLADETSSGVRYDVSLGTAKPQLGREVLIEGVIAEGANACGGIVLQPVRTSTLRSTCSGAIIPAEGFPGRRYVSDLPQQLAQTWVVRDELQPPFSEQRYSIVFDFDTSFLNYQYSEVILDRAARYALASKARSVRVTGYAATRGINVSGQILREPPALARERAEMVTEALLRLDVPGHSIALKWRGDAQPLEQPLREASKRRVDIVVSP